MELEADVAAHLALCEHSLRLDLYEFVVGWRQDDSVNAGDAS